METFALALLLFDLTSNIRPAIIGPLAVSYL